MKKGVSHIDWVISMGIFLIAVISIFVYLKPFSRELYVGEDLTDIVKDKFNEEVNWVIKELPLFVESCTLEQGESFSVVLTFENGWKNLDGQSSFTTTVSGRHILYLHNLDSSKEFKVSLGITPLHCQDEVTLGVVENTVGISGELIDTLKNRGYKTLRESWNFPPGRDFAIFMDGERIIGIEPYQRANIYAEETKEFIVNKDGSLEEVLINFRVW